mmetsp:Transcript_9107/g.17751  ORF Transcript_9107/g.17751 Transcript_9107/m.17751 type:complete len:147 (-) Transcript_9107:109-549(-)
MKQHYNQQQQQQHTPPPPRDQLPPTRIIRVRSLREFFFRFNAQAFEDPDRLMARMKCNLGYYLGNYFLIGLFMSMMYGFGFVNSTGFIVWTTLIIMSHASLRPRPYFTSFRGSALRQRFAKVGEIFGGLFRRRKQRVLEDASPPPR